MLVRVPFGRCRGVRRVALVAGRRVQAASDAFQRFVSCPSVALASMALRQEDDPGRAWHVFQMVVESRAELGVKFFHLMMSFCKRQMQSKAPDVLAAAVSHDVPVDGPLFCGFLDACQRGIPPLVDEALSLYFKCAPRSHATLFAIARLCRFAKQPERALPVILDAVQIAPDHITVGLLSVFAVCCAEARLPFAADVAERLLQLIQSKRGALLPDGPAFGNLMKTLILQKRLEQAYNVMSVMASLRLPIPVQMYTHILSALAKHGDTRQAMVVFQNMVDGNVAVDSPVLASLIAACGRAADVATVRTLHSYAAVENLLQSEIVASAFISAYDLCHDLDAAEKVFDASSARPNVHTLNAMMAAYNRRSMVQRALAVYERFKHVGLRFDMKLLHNVLSILVKAGLVHQALEVFDALSEHGTAPVSYPAFAMLVGACGRSSDSQALRKLYQHASRFSLLNNVVVVSAFAAAYGRCVELADVQSLEQHAKLLLKHDAVASAFISAYDRCRHLEGAERVFTARCTSVTRPGVETFNAIIAAYSHHGMLEKALAVVQHVKDSRLPVNMETYTTILSVLVKGDRVAEALSVFIAMVSQRFVVDTPVFASLVASCGRLSYVLSLRSLRRYAQEHGLLTNEIVLCAFIAAYDLCGDVNTAMHIFQSRRNTDVATFHAMMAAFVRHGRFSEAAELFQQYASSGLPLERDETFNILCGFARANRIDEAFTVFNTLVGRGVPVPSIALSVLVVACGRRVNLASVRTLYEYACDRSLTQNVVLGSALLFAFDACGDINAAEKMFAAQCRAGDADPSLFKAMVGAYCRRGMRSHAVETLERMKQAGVLVSKADLYKVSLSHTLPQTGAQELAHR